ncbi:MAG: gas vesicle protein [Planctomycetes bacterium]|nr:gas vesicle protein [Acidobacteriota bacterium]MBI3465559.1 gas vesicle protein [Planctomycetota bacterium]
MDVRSIETAPTLSAQDRVSLCEALDRVLNKGAVVVGELTISVADIELIYLGLQVVITSIEKARSLATISAPTAPEAADGHR